MRDAPLSFAEAAALAEQGLQAQEAGDHAGAIAFYRRAEAQLAAVPELYNNLALCELALRHVTAAEEALRRALILRPGYPEAHNNLGLVLQQTGRQAEALQAFQTALEAEPIYAHAAFNLGTLYLEMGQPRQAAEALERALALTGGEFPKAAMNLGLARLEQGDIEGALSAYAEGHAAAPDDIEISLNQALARLMMGDWERGWDEYEVRWRLPSHAPLPYTMPRWRGEDLAGKRILLWTEQGAGTSIQFLRYAPLIAARGARVTVACEEPLFRLFEVAEGVSSVIPRTAVERDYDFHMPLASAAWIFGTRLETVPPPAHFAVPPGLSTSNEGALRIALAWSGNPAFSNNARRGVPLASLAPLARATGERAVWKAFQQGEADLSAWPADGPSLTPPPSFADFYATALALREIDLVVTSDTSLAHLAGSLGLPVALLLMFMPDWRWQRGGESDPFDARTPWYPSVRLFRQRVAGQWEAPLTALAAVLKTWQGGPL